MLHVEPSSLARGMPSERESKTFRSVHNTILDRFPLTFFPLTFSRLPPRSIRHMQGTVQVCPAQRIQGNARLTNTAHLALLIADHDAAVAIHPPHFTHDSAPPISPQTLRPPILNIGIPISFVVALRLRVIYLLF